MRLNSRYPDESCSSPPESESDSSSVGIPILSPYDPFTSYLTPRPKFLRYDLERHREILRRMEEATMDGFGGMSIGSDSEGSISEDSAKQEQEDSDSDGVGNEVEMLPICSLRWLCELLLLLLVLALFMACICHRSISSPPQKFEDWHRSSSCRCEDFSDKIVESVEIAGSNKSISSPSYDIEGRHGNLSFTHEEPPEKIVKFFESKTDAIQTDVDSSSGDIEEAAECVLINEVMKGLLRENYQYGELDETLDARDGGVGKRVEDEPQEFSNVAETRVKKNDGVESNFYWIKKNSEPRRSAVAESEVGSETENLLLQETREVDKVTSARIELVTIVVVYGSATAVLAYVLVLYSRRKKNLANDSYLTKGHSFTALPINWPCELAEKLERDDRLASDRVSSFPLENSPLLGSFTTTEMISTNREDGTGEAWISIATPVRRSRRICDRAIRSRRQSMSSS